MRYIFQACVFNAATGAAWYDLDANDKPGTLENMLALKQRLDKLGKITRIIAVIVDVEE